MRAGDGRGGPRPTRDPQWSGARGSRGEKRCGTRHLIRAWSTIQVLFSVLVVTFSPVSGGTSSRRVRK